MGHTVNSKPDDQGDAHSIAVDPSTGLYHPAPDRRIDGRAAAY